MPETATNFCGRIQSIIVRCMPRQASFSIKVIGLCVYMRSHKTSVFCSACIGKRTRYLKRSCGMIMIVVVSMVVCRNFVCSQYMGFFATDSVNSVLPLFCREQKSAIFPFLPYTAPLTIRIECKVCGFIHCTYWVSGQIKCTEQVL